VEEGNFNVVGKRARRLQGTRRGSGGQNVSRQLHAPKLDDKGAAHAAREVRDALAGRGLMSPRAKTHSLASIPRRKSTTCPPGQQVIKKNDWMTEERSCATWPTPPTNSITYDQGLRAGYFVGRPPAAREPIQGVRGDGSAEYLEESGMHQAWQGIPRGHTKRTSPRPAI